MMQKAQRYFDELQDITAELIETKSEMKKKELSIDSLELKLDKLSSSDYRGITPKESKHSKKFS